MGSAPEELSAAAREARSDTMQVHDFNLMHVAGRVTRDVARSETMQAELTAGRVARDDARSETINLLHASDSSFFEGCSRPSPPLPT